MIRLSKKFVAIIAFGTLILLAAVPFAVQAAQGTKDRPGFTQRNMDPDKTAERLAETFDISKAAILEQYNNGSKFRDIRQAAFLAKTSGKSFEAVLAMKTPDNKWRDIAQNLGITRDQMKATHRSLSADRLNAKLGLDRQTTLGLLNQGYRPHDVAVAGLLAKDTGKSSQDILAMRKINNTWRDVAQTLGVSDDILKQDMQKLRQISGRHSR